MGVVHDVVHGRGPRGSLWTGGQRFQVSHTKEASRDQFQMRLQKMCKQKARIDSNN